MNIIISLVNAMKNEQCFLFNSPLILEKGIRNLKRGRKIVGVIIHHPTEFPEEMHCTQIS